MKSMRVTSGSPAPAWEGNLVQRTSLGRLSGKIPYRIDEPLNCVVPLAQQSRAGPARGLEAASLPGNSWEAAREVMPQTTHG